MPCLRPEDLFLHQQALLAVLVFHGLWRPVAEGQIHVVIPQRQQLQDMAVGIDDVVRTEHDLFLGAFWIPFFVNIAQQPIAGGC